MKPKHIKEIQDAHLNFENIERVGDDGLAAKVFDNTDFGYYKLTIDRPNRLKAQFSDERIADLRFDKSIRETVRNGPMKTYGEQVYIDIKSIEKELLDWCRKNEPDLNAKKLKTLTNPATWKKQQDI